MKNQPQNKKALVEAFNAMKVEAFARNSAVHLITDSPDEARSSNLLLYAHGDTCRQVLKLLDQIIPNPEAELPSKDEDVFEMTLGRLRQIVADSGSDYGSVSATTTNELFLYAKGDTADDIRAFIAEKKRLKESMVNGAKA